MTSSILKPSRRGFIGFLGALAVAPAIVHSANIMPIKVFAPLETYGPGGLLTAEMIAREMARQVSMAGAVPISNYLQIHGQNQSGVNMYEGVMDRMVSLEQYAERILKPAASKLAQHAKKIGIAPTLPRGVDDAAIGEYGGISVRFVKAYDISVDAMLTRFDVTHA